MSASIVARAVALVVTAHLTIAAAVAGAEPLTFGAGAWCWFADPRAITHDGRTYVGWVGSDGDILVSSIDHASGERVTAVLHSRLNVDDHANPALQLREDGRLIVYYSAHKGPSMSYRVSEHPSDVRAWGPPQQVPTNTSGPFGFTYPNPQHLEAENRTYLFWRGGNFQPAFSTLPDDGGAWAPARQLIDSGGGRPYVKVAGDGERTIHFGFTNRHPNEDGDVNIHYAAYRDGEIVRADGSVIGSLDAPIAPGDADLVFDRPENAWIHDVAVDPAGRPVLVFASFPSIGSHRYHYARWTGETWDVHDITEAGGSFPLWEGEPMYSGGLTLDHDDPSRVHLSRQDEGGWQIETWTTDDGGATWVSKPVSQPGVNVRPISPRGNGAESGGLSVLWMRGVYYSYTDYRTRIVGLSDLPAPPTIDVEGSPAAGQAPLEVRFDAAVIDGEAGSVVEWDWRFGDGATATGRSVVEHVFTEPGTYFPALTVTDAAGRRDTFVTEVTVHPGAGPVPSPVAGALPEPVVRSPAHPLLRIRKARSTAHGLRVRLACVGSRACRGRVLARHQRSGRVLARARVRVAPGTARWITLRLTRRARRALAGRRRVPIVLLALDRADRVHDTARLQISMRHR